MSLVRVWTRRRGERFLQFLERLGRGIRPPALVLVTHHVEEIMPVFSHVLVLKKGKVLAFGPRESTLTGRTLSEAFAEPMRLRRKQGRYSLQFSQPPTSAIL